MRVGQRGRSRQMVVSKPLIDQPVRDEHPELRNSIFLIEVSNMDVISRRSANMLNTHRTRRNITDQLHGLSAGCSFPRLDIRDHVTCELHLLGFITIPVVSHASLFIGNAGAAHEPVANRIAPDLSMTRLVL